MAKLIKKDRAVADAVINCVPMSEALPKLGITLDEFHQRLDKPEVRQFIADARERQIFLVCQTAIQMMQQVLDGTRKRQLSQAEKSMCELALKINGLGSSKKPINDKTGSGVEDLIDPTPISN